VSDKNQAICADLLPDGLKIRDIAL